PADHDDEHLLDHVVGVSVLSAERPDPGAQQGRVQGDEMGPRFRVAGLAEPADQGKRGREHESDLPYLTSAAARAKGGGRLHRPPASFTPPLAPLTPISPLVKPLQSRTPRCDLP